MGELKSMRSCYIRSFCMTLAVAFGYKQFVKSPEQINNIFRYAPKLCNIGFDHFGLVEGSRTILQRVLGNKEDSYMRQQLEDKGEILLPWLVKSRANDWIAIRLQYAKTHLIEQDCSWGNAKQEELENSTTMGFWNYYSKFLGKRGEAVHLLDFQVAALVLAFAVGYTMVAEQAFLDISFADYLGLMGSASNGKEVNSKAERRVRLSLGAAFIAAAACGDVRVIELFELVEAKIGNMLLQGDFANTALQVAAENGHEAIVQMLIEKGVDVNAAVVRNSGKTAVQAAAGHGHEAIMKLLINAGAAIDAEAARDSGRTALQAAAENGHEAIVKLLIDKGVDVNALAAKYSGRTALQAATQNGHEAIVKLLRHKGAVQ